MRYACSLKSSAAQQANAHGPRTPPSPLGHFRNDAPLPARSAAAARAPCFRRAFARQVPSIRSAGAVRAEIAALYLSFRHALLRSAGLKTPLPQGPCLKQGLA